MSSKGWNSDLITDQSGRVVVITGATSGIGKEAARVLGNKGAKVIIGARNMSKANAVVGELNGSNGHHNIEARPLDLTSLASIAAFSASILNDFDKLDVLINNAGIMACPYGLTQDGFEIQMGTNHLGHFALTGQLMPLLKTTKESRIVVLSSIAHKFGDIDLDDLQWKKRKYNTNRAYGDSKLANLYFMRQLIQNLKEDDSAPIVVAAHPGWTHTELQRHVKLVDKLNRFFSQDVSQGALPTLRAGFGDNVKSGEFYGPSGCFELQGPPVKVKSNKRSHDAAMAKKLWHQSQQLTSVYF